MYCGEHQSAWKLRKIIAIGLCKVNELKFR